MNKSLPRCIVVRKLWWNYHFYSPCNKHLANKFLESNIEFHKQRQKKGWIVKYRQHEEMFNIWFAAELAIDHDIMQLLLEKIYADGNYPKHLERKLEQAIGVFGITKEDTVQ